MLAIAFVLLLLAFMLSLYLDTTDASERLYFLADILVGGAGLSAALVLLGQLCPMMLRGLIEYAIAHPWHG